MGQAQDLEFMKQALDLARLDVGNTSPNPAVGAIVVREGAVISSGHYRGPGSKHAEREALDATGDSRGATVYVTLEPCQHHGSTPPCTVALVDAGIARVVFAVADPDDRTRGSGRAALEKAGIAVTEGVMETEAKKLNEAYFHHRLEGRPLVAYKVASTLDGRSAAPDGTSQWITGEEARRDAHTRRAQSDAICVGVGTVLADDPRLTARDVPGTQPIRVVIDSRGRTPPGAKVVTEEGEVIVVVTAKAPESSKKALTLAGAEVLELPSDGDRVSLKHLLDVLGSRDIISLLLEGGPKLAGAFQGAGLIDKYLFYFAPKLLGDGAALLPGWSAGNVELAKQLTIESITRLGPDVLIEANAGDS